MRIQHNIAALNANRQLSSNNSAISKNLEKLSSGYAINRAGDDAAGLAISEKMRAQITGLGKAQDNANDGISLVQTAEGALTEVHSMLNRMTELATQSANGTYDDSTDRANLQEEVDSLVTEINRIAKSTNYNGITLLDGSLSSEAATSTTASADAVKALSVSGDAVSLETSVVTKDKYVSAGITGTTGGAGSADITLSYVDEDGTAQTLELTGVALADTATETGNNGAVVAALNANTEFNTLFTASVDATTSELVITAKNAGEDEGQVTGLTATINTSAGLAVDGSRSDSSQNVGDVTATMTFTGAKLTDESKVTIGDKTYQILDDVSKVEDGCEAIQRGTTSDETLSNLLGALKTDGVTSATLDPTADTITVTDITQIQSSQKGAQITTDSSAVTINNTAAVAGEYTQAVSAGTDGVTQTLTVNYIDEAGKQQAKELSYVSSSTTDVTNGTAIGAAIEDDETLSKLFDVKVSTADGTITLTAKTAGTDGAQIVSMETTDTATDAIDGARSIAVSPEDAGKKLSLDANALESGDTVTVDGKTFEFVTSVNDVKTGNVAVLIDTSKGTDAEDNKSTAKNLAAAMASEGIDMSYDPGTGKINFADNAESTTNKGGLTLQIGETADSYNQLTVSINAMDAKSLGIEDIDISGQEGAKAAIELIESAINSVSKTRGNLGAVQNRLEYTINNLSVAEENITSAESRIRDTDMASEMMEYTKNNILIQASQSMLAQANQLPQGVLQLLQ